MEELLFFTKFIILFERVFKEDDKEYLFIYKKKTNSTYNVEATLPPNALDRV